MTGRFRVGSLWLKKLQGNANNVDIIERQVRDGSRARRSSARSHDRRACHADLSDDVLRL
ncbi:protein of unknown function [Hyphomicrobium sp. MC1]|nr:protein of unknown function [Hyphomicrobium sp. MC1]